MLRELVVISQLAEVEWKKRKTWEGDLNVLLTGIEEQKAGKKFLQKAVRLQRKNVPRQ